MARAASGAKLTPQKRRGENNFAEPPVAVALRSQRAGHVRRESRRTDAEPPLIQPPVLQPRKYERSYDEKP